VNCAGERLVASVTAYLRRRGIPASVAKFI
jgi:hypothetical protein